MDKISQSRRSENMKAIRSENTKPEQIVRSLLRTLNYKGYRLHRKELPGKPDIVFIGRKKAILVHGCFWHGHNECYDGRRRPKTNREYWLPKIAKNQQRDAQNLSALKGMGWDVMIVWACEVKDQNIIKTKLAAFMHDKG